MERTIRQFVVFIITVTAIIIFGATLVHALFYAPEVEIAVPNASTTPGQEVDPSERPSQVIIPALKIDADVQHVGVKPDGSMGTPNNFTDVAWYKYGPAPGYRGSAVIDGHVDNGLSLAGVFKHLGDIKVGDDVYVKTAGGKTLHFVVEDVETYPYQSVPTEKIFERADKPRLNLITCDGKWVKGKDTYDERLVVYTVLAP